MLYVYYVYMYINLVTMGLSDVHTHRNTAYKDQRPSGTTNRLLCLDINLLADLLILTDRYLLSTRTILFQFHAYSLSALLLPLLYTTFSQSLRYRTSSHLSRFIVFIIMIFFFCFYVSKVI
jgi:hypothetical protein